MPSSRSRAACSRARIRSEKASTCSRRFRAQTATAPPRPSGGLARRARTPLLPHVRHRGHRPRRARARCLAPARPQFASDGCAATARPTAAPSPGQRHWGDASSGRLGSSSAHAARATLRPRDGSGWRSGRSWVTSLTHGWHRSVPCRRAPPHDRRPRVPRPDHPTPPHTGPQETRSFSIMRRGGEGSIRASTRGGAPIPAVAMGEGDAAGVVVGGHGAAWRSASRRRVSAPPRGSRTAEVRLVRGGSERARVSDPPLTKGCREAERHA